MPPRPCSQLFALCRVVLTCFLFGRFNRMAFFFQEFCDSMKGLRLSYMKVVWYKDPGSLWLCDVEFCAGRFITARVRKTRKSPVETVRILVEDFFRRIHKAFAVVSVFWFEQVRFDTQWLNLSPIDEVLQRECSWIFAIDTSEKGAMFLRMLLRGELGCYSLYKTAEKEIRLSIVRRARSLPVFQRIIDCTPDSEQQLSS